MVDFIGFVLSQLPPPPGRIRFHGRLATQEELLGRYPMRTEGPIDAVVLEGWQPALRKLDAALDRARELLRPGGLLVLEQPAPELLDDPTRDWFEGQRRALAAAGIEARGEWAVPQLPLDELRRKLDARFEERFAGFGPYLYRDLGGPATLALEEGLIDAGAIRALAFRYVGVAKRAIETAS